MAFGLRNARDGRGRDRPPDRMRRRRRLEIDRTARAQARPAFGRPAPARRHRPRDRQGAAAVPVRRAAVQPRRRAARRAPGSNSPSCTSGFGTTMIFVTHDQVEAMTLADRIVVMNGRRDRAGRHADGDLPAAGDPLRRDLRRHAADQPPAGGGRGAGERRARRSALGDGTGSSRRSPPPVCPPDRMTLGLRAERVRPSPTGDGDARAARPRSSSGSATGRWSMSRWPTAPRLVAEDRRRSRRSSPATGSASASMAARAHLFDADGIGYHPAETADGDAAPGAVGAVPATAPKRRRRPVANACSSLPYLAVFVLMLVDPAGDGHLPVDRPRATCSASSNSSGSPISPGCCGDADVPADGLEHLLLRAADRAGAGA